MKRRVESVFERQEVFALDEGDVTLTFPASLSTQSYQDLADYLELFLRKAKRCAVADRKVDRNEVPEDQDRVLS